MADRPHSSSIAGEPYDGTTFSYIPAPDGEMRASGSPGCGYWTWMRSK